MNKLIISNKIKQSFKNKPLSKKLYKSDNDDYYVISSIADLDEFDSITKIYFIDNVVIITPHGKLYIIELEYNDNSKRYVISSNFTAINEYFGNIICSIEQCSKSDFLIDNN